MTEAEDTIYQPVANGQNTTTDATCEPERVRSADGQDDLLRTGGELWPEYWRGWTSSGGMTWRRQLENLKKHKDGWCARDVAKWTKGNVENN